VLATVKRARRRCGRPRGRTTTRNVSRRKHTPRTGRLGSQGVGGAVVCFAETGRALRRRCELDGAERQCREKQRKKAEENGDGVGFIARPRSTEKPRSSLLMPVQSQRWPRARLEDVGSSPTVRCRPAVLFPLITELPLALILKLLPNLYGNSKISKNKSCSKIKFYNFALITIPKLCLHFEMQV